MEVLSYPQFRPSHRLSMDKTIAPHLNSYQSCVGNLYNSLIPDEVSYKRTLPNLNNACLSRLPIIPNHFT